MGYAPLFDSLTKGTLCGRWPDIGLWPIVLSLSDRHGEVDVTPAYLSSVTGLPLDDVVACMKRFCEPDKFSRSGAEGGARLVLLDAHRDWGWRIVNHGLYREKARKQMQQIVATETGRDADRKRIARESESSRVRRSPAKSRADRLSDSDSDSDSDSEKNSTAAAQPTRHPNPPEFSRFKLTYPARAGSQPWRRALQAINARIKDGDSWGEILAGAERYAQFIAETGKTNSEFVMQAATFVGPDKHYLQPWSKPLGDGKGDTGWRPTA